MAQSNDNLMLDDNFYCLTSNNISAAIYKNQTNEKIKTILDNIKNYNLNVLKFDFNELIFDDELQEKIKEIYGSLYSYKQKN